MKAYSNDLRERVAAACAAPGATQTAVAARFCVSVSGGGLKRNDFDSNETKAAFEKAVSTATQKRVLLLG